MSKIWAGYGRVSRVGDRTDTLISDKQQVERNTEFAARRGLELEQFPIELDVSGAKSSRPILDEIMNGIEDGRYAGVVVPVLDRLSRMDMLDALVTIRRIEEAGGQVLSAGEDWDTTTPEGEMARNMMLSMANMMWRRYSNQLAGAKEQAVVRGIWPMPVVPIGYRLDADRHLERDPATAPIVRRAFEARAANLSMRDVGQILNRSPSGARAVIKNRVYLGEITLKGIATNPAAHEPLVDRALWDDCQRQMPRPGRKRGGEPSLLSGIVRCAGCSRTMSPDVHPVSGLLYRCTRSAAAGRCEASAVIVASVIEPYVEQAALERIAGLGAEARENVDLAAIEREVSDAEVELGAFVEHTKISDVGELVYRRGMEARTNALQDARQRLARARGLVAPQEMVMLGDLWPELTVRQRNHALRGLLGVVWVRRGRLPVTDRVRIVLAGHEPSDLPQSGSRRYPITAVDWPEGDLPGEIRPELTQDVAERASRAG